jgi:undecaprenyl-diphosphatase
LTPATRDRVQLGAASLGIGLAALALSVVVAGAGIGRWETATVRDAVGVTDVLGYPARAIMQLGTRVVIAAVAVAVAVITRRWRPPVAIALAWLIARLATNWSKAAIERPRPDSDLWLEDPGGWGYASGHTSTAFAAATVVATLLPGRWRWVPFALAAVVGLARMHVGVHYPMDVIGGALIGLAAGLAALAVLRPWAGVNPRES